MLGAVCIAAYNLLLPSEIVNLSRSVMSSALYYSNIYFYHHIDYFHIASFEPLLHTWSLAVEEQFYLVMPIATYFVFRFLRRNTLALLLAVCLVSYGVNEFWVNSEAKNAAFYLMPARMWQFCIGGIVAIVPRPRLATSVETLASMIATAGILASCWFITEKMPFPGTLALLPTLCTALLLFFGQSRQTFVGRALSLPPMRFFGKISYSMYLFHWPIIVFYRMAASPNPTLSEQIGLFAASTAAGALSYIMIEVPTRHIKITRRAGRLIAGGLAASVAFAGLGRVAIVNRGLPERLPANVQNTVSYLDYSEERWRRGVCFLYDKSKSVDDFDPARCIKTNAEKPNILLFGDSHAAHYYPAIERILKDYNISQVTTAGCRPVFPPPGSNYCYDLVTRALKDYIPNLHFDAIIMSGLWFETDIPELNRTIEYISAHTKQVYVFGPSMRYSQKLPRLLASSYLSGRGGKLFFENMYYDPVKNLDKKMKQTINKKAHYISTIDIICPNRKCVTEIANEPANFDDSHLTEGGAAFVLQHMLESEDIGAIIR